MDYASFRQFWDDALRSAGLVSFPFDAQETLDPEAQSRFYRIVIPDNIARVDENGFFVTTTFKWVWEALHAARFRTTEEDMLTELFGRKRRPKRTERPWLRVDVQLNASIPMDRHLPLPETSVWPSWAASVRDSVAPLLPTRFEDAPHPPPIVSWCGEPEIKLSSSPAGQLYLHSVNLPAFQLIRLPRHWDDPDRRPDPSPDRELLDFFRRVKHARAAWRESLDRINVGGSA